MARSRELVHQPQEHRLPSVSGQQPYHDLPARFHVLRWHAEEVIDEGSKLQPQELLLLGLVLLVPAAVRGWQAERQPGFEVPGQGVHQHVGPVAGQVIDWVGKESHAPIEPGNEILLLAAVVGREDDGLGRAVPVVVI